MNEQSTTVLAADRVVSSVEMAAELATVEPQQAFNTGYYHLDKMLNGVKEGDLMILSGLTGNGKCLGKGTPVLMFDGTIKEVQNVRVGDLLMGDDSRPRKVLSVGRGRENLYRVIPTKGDSYVVNESHILSLVRSNRSSGKNKQDGKIVDIEVKDYLGLSAGMKHILKGYRVPVDFNGEYEGIPPYLLGLWLGDGNSRYTSICSMDFEVINYLESYASENSLNFHQNEQKDNRSYELILSGDRGKKNNFFLKFLQKNGLILNKHIPLSYKTTEARHRLELLAGLIDTDGCLSSGYYEYCTKSDVLRDDVLFISRSLGFAAYSRDKYVNGTKYNRISISGEISRIPVKIWRKKAQTRNQIKDVLRTGIKLKSEGVGEYYGFEIDGNRRFLLGDFTVTHNTEFAVSLARRFIEQDIPPLFFSYEISSAELMERFGTPVPLFYLPRLPTSKSPQWIEKKIEEAIQKFKTKVVFIDHLHYLVDDYTTRSKNTSEMLGQLCRDFKQIARRQRVVVVLLAHVRKFQTARPNIQDIKDSSGIVQEADTVLIIHRAGKKRSRKSAQDILEEEIDVGNESKLYVDKVRRRGGKLGVIDFVFEDGVFKELV